MAKVAVFTGAGSGVGRVVALRMAMDGWHVAVVARRAETLEETQRLAGDRADAITAIACDVASESDVSSMARRVLDELGTPAALVNNAGMNVPRRGLDVLSIQDFRTLIDVNLIGAFLCVHVFLPAMRQSGGGTIVNVVSDAGRFPNDF